MTPLNLTKITQREKDILKLIMDELSSAEIAEKLNLSLRTVETHRKNILRKTGAKNIVGVIKYAVKHQIVTL